MTRLTKFLVVPVQDKISDDPAQSFTVIFATSIDAYWDTVRTLDDSDTVDAIATFDLESSQKIAAFLDDPL